MPAQPNFRSYTQRLERCRAVQFTDTSQASDIARAFDCWTEWTLVVHDTTFELTLCPPGKTAVTIGRGDYVVISSAWCSPPTVMKQREFEEKFETRLKD